MPIVGKVASGHHALAHLSSKTHKKTKASHKGVLKQIQNLEAQFSRLTIQKAVTLYEAKKAFLSKEAQKAETAFQEIIKGNKAEDLYRELAADKSTTKELEQFKKLYCKYAVEQAVKQNSPTILSQDLAEKCNIKAMPKEKVIKTLQEVAKSTNNTQIARIANEIDAISKIEFGRHKLMPIDMLQICIVADTVLETLSQTLHPVYLRGLEQGICRSCVIDPVNRSFTILSKSHGELYAEGAFKRVSDAVEIAIKGETATAARRVAHVRNKADEYVPESEIEYERRYGKIISWLRYSAKNRPYETKTIFLQEVYDHDLYIFTEFTPEERRKTISLEDLVSVLYDAGKTLLKMHEDGLAHRDVKAKNVLYMKDSNGKVHGKLIDYGHTYVPTAESQLRKRKRGYGTLRYTSPDVLEKPSLKGDPLFLAKAEDAYALGEMIYEVYLQQATPWGSLAYRALKGKSKAKEKRKEAIRLQKEEAAYIDEISKTPPKTLEKELFAITARLLEPNPFKRMQLPEFMRALRNLKSKCAIVEPTRS